MISANITEIRSAIMNNTFTLIGGEVDSTLARVIAVGEERGHTVASFDLAATTFEELESRQIFHTDSFTMERVLPESIKNADMIVFTHMDFALDDALNFFNEFRLAGRWDGVPAIKLKNIVGIVDGYSSTADMDERIHAVFSSMIGFEGTPAD